MSDQLRSNALINDTLGSALRSGGNALGTVPALLKRVLAEESWRDFVTKRDEHVRHERFADFVATPPLRGLGADMALIERIVGTSDPDLLRMLREARKVGHGRRTDLLDGESPSSIADETTPRDAERLAREAPEEYAAVQRGEKSIHAAAISAGFRKRRIPVRLDDPDSAAETLRKHMSREARLRLAELLTKED